MVTAPYIHGPGIDEPPAKLDSSGVATYYHADGHGSIVKMTNAAGAVVDTREYDAWGNLQEGSAEPGYSFTGREWDPETGLYYYRARYYDPKAGRFISEDPARLRGGLNLYAYVLGNPVRFRDPRGLWAAGFGAGGNGGLAAGPIGVAGEADCKAVVDGHGNIGLLCCAGAGPAVGFAEEVGVVAAGIFCLTCRTICDLEDIYVTMQAGGGAGAGASGSGGRRFGTSVTPGL